MSKVEEIRKVVKDLLKKYQNEKLALNTVLNIQIELMNVLKPYMESQLPPLDYPLLCTVGDVYRIVVNNPSNSHIEQKFPGDLEWEKVELK